MKRRGRAGGDAADGRAQIQGGTAVRNWSTLKERVSGRRWAGWGVAGALAATFAVLLTGSGSAAPAAGPERTLGWRAQLGAAR